MKEIIRIPRPLGTTLFNKNLNKNKQDIRELQRYIIKRYLEDSMRINNEPMSIEQLSLYLNMDKMTLMRELTRSMSTFSGLLGKGDNMEQVARALLNTTISWSLSDRHTTIAQVEALKASQGNSYKPFVSSTLNQAIANQLSQTRAFFDIAKSLITPQKGSVIVNQNNQNNINETHTYVGPNEAVKLIDENRTKDLLQDPDQQHNLYLNHHIKGLPEVVATKQQYNPEGSFIIPPKLKSIDHHENRREDDGPIEEADIIP